MRTEDMRPSSNIEDARGGGGGGFGGSRIGIPIGGRGLGIGGVIFIVLFLIMGGNPLALLGGGGGRRVVTSGSNGVAPGWQAEEKEVVTRVLGDTEDVWSELFKEQGLRYVPPKLVLFTDAVESGCGHATAEVGPFYCPADAQIYLDLSFYRDLAGRFKAPGDFPQAYVVAHEVGHHIQHRLGLARKVAPGDNDASIRLELQADYLAGVWAHYASKRGLLDAGDIEEGLAAAAAIGDDRLQRQATGRVVPDSFTHGTSTQRVKWFRKGFESGDPRVTDGGPGDTFGVKEP